MLKSTDVFKTQGTPVHTYVSVSDGTYEKSLSNAIRNKGTLCLVTGPSKTGKTTLVSNVCNRLELRPIIVRCSTGLSAQNLWRKALEQIDFSRFTTYKAASGKSAEVGGEIAGALGWSWLASLTGKFSTKLVSQRSEEENREKILADPGPEHLIPVLSRLPLLLVVEDFHYLTIDTQKAVFQEWKAFVDDEVSVVVLGTTHHACDLAFANKDLIGRIHHLPLITWTERDLCEIVEKGFDKLNVRIVGLPMKRVARESVGLPLLTQAICLQICEAKNIDVARENVTEIELGARELYRYLYAIAHTRFSQFETMYERIRVGMRAKKKKRYNTYEYLLSVFSLDPIVYKLAFEQIIERLKTLPVPAQTVPTQRIVNGALTRLFRLQEQMGSSLLEWSSRDRTLYILEPTFLFYLRWRKQRTSEPKIFDLFKELIQALEVQERNGVISVTVSGNQRE